MRQKQDQPENAQPLAPPDENETPAWLIAARAAESKKALRPVVLDLRGISTFTDYFLICSGANSRQIQAICDEVGGQLEGYGHTPLGLEGYQHAEWILADYGDLIIHVFSEPARAFYDLERLWRDAQPLVPGQSP